MSHTKPKFFQTKIFNTPVLGDASVASQKAVITGLESFEIDKVLSFTRKVFAAGTAAIKDIDFAAVTVLNLANYRMDVLLLDDISTKKTYFFNSDATATLAEIKAGFIAAINANTNSDVTATDGGADLMRLTAKKVDFDFDVNDPSGITIAVITPHVAPAGTQAIAATFDSVNASSGANYTTYDIVYLARERNNFIQGAFVQNTRKAVIFAEQTSTPGYTQFDARMLQMFVNSQIDAVLQDAAFASTITSIAADTTMTQLNSLVLVDTTGGDIDITMADSATLGPRMLVFIETAGAGNSIIFKRAGADTLNGGAGDVTVTIDKSALVINDGAGDYRIVEFA